jgi:uncharacterized protein Usg
MNLEQRLSAFFKLGAHLSEQLRSPDAEFTTAITRANLENAWFTEESIRFAFSAVADDLNEKNLTDWTGDYPHLQQTVTPKTVAVVMAGNLPLVGFRDFLAVLISGHKLLCKPSSKDTVLLRYLADKLIHIEPKFAERICIEEHIIKGFDAVIATGGHHAVEHFHQYFQKYPHIIRGHRNSCAILEGTENTDALSGLFEDMFRYFGLGCRNVTKLYVPKHYDFQPLAEIVKKQIDLYQSLEQHHLYQNNYQYQKVVSALNSRQVIDTGVFALIENSVLAPPISVIHYEYYSDLAEVKKNLSALSDQIQCIVSHTNTPFGMAQQPSLSDYADGIDTMKFLA